VLTSRSLRPPAKGIDAPVLSTGSGGRGRSSVGRHRVAIDLAKVEADTLEYFPALLKIDTSNPPGIDPA
jgi:hypothetical protein